MLTIRRSRSAAKRQAGAEVVTRQLRKIGQNLLLAHPGGKVRKHVTDGDARSPHTRFPKPNFGVCDDPSPVVHTGDHKRAAENRQGSGGAGLRARGHPPLDPFSQISQIVGSWRPIFI